MPTRNGLSSNSIRSDFYNGVPQKDRDNPLYKVMPAGSVENIVKQYQRAKAYDERIGSMSDSSIEKEVKDFRDFAKDATEKIDKMTEQFYKTITEDTDNFTARQGSFSQMNEFASQIRDYFEQRRTANPADSVVQQFVRMEEQSYPNSKEYKELVTKIKADTKWLDSNSSIDGVSAEKRAVTKERLSDNLARIGDLEDQAAHRLEIAKDAFKTLFKV